VIEMNEDRPVRHRSAPFSVNALPNQSGQSVERALIDVKAVSLLTGQKAFRLRIGSIWTR